MTIVADTVKTTDTDAVEVVTADRRAEIARILALGLCRLQAEHEGVVRKRMRTPEPRSEAPAVTPSITSRYDLLTPARQSESCVRQADAQPDGPAGRDAKRGPRRRRGGAEPDHEGDAR